MPEQCAYRMTSQLDDVEQWYVETVTRVSTYTSAIDVTASVHGPAKVMLETWNLLVTKSETTLSLSTHMAVSYEFEALTTIRSNVTTTKTVSRTRTTTRQVAYNTASSTSKAVVYTPPSDFPSALFPLPPEQEYT